MVVLVLCYADSVEGDPLTLQPLVRTILKLPYIPTPFLGGPQTNAHFAVIFEGDHRNNVRSNVYFEGDPQNITLLKPYLHTKKQYRNVANSVLNTEQI